MIRFHAHDLTVKGSDIAGLISALVSMRDFVQVDDLDAAHVMSALGYEHADIVKGVEPAGLLRQATILIRQIDLGRGKDFSRSPSSATDDGMDEFEVKGLALSLCDLAAMCVGRGRKLSALIFDQEFLPQT
jgi:hypothetical protein